MAEIEIQEDDAPKDSIVPTMISTAYMADIKKQLGTPLTKPKKKRKEKST